MSTESSASSTRTSSGSSTRTPRSPSTSLSATRTSSQTTSFLQTYSTETPANPTSTRNGGGGPFGAGNTGGGNVSPSTTSASLYLYTFLATLILLLAVSGAIVTRSLILRRRHRAMIEEAIRNGTWIPPTPGGSSGRKDVGEKPKLFDASVHLENGGSKSEADAKDWDDILPFSASYINPPRNTTTDASTPSLPVPVAAMPQRSRTQRFVDFLLPSPRPLSFTSTTPPDGATTTTTNTNTNANSDTNFESTDPNAPAKLRVAVLIAMPSATSSTHSPPSQHSDDEVEIPHVEFGVVDLVVSAPPSVDGEPKDGVNRKDSEESSSQAVNAGSANMV